MMKKNIRILFSVMQSTNVEKMISHMKNPILDHYDIVTRKDQYYNDPILDHYDIVTRKDQYYLLENKYQYDCMVVLYGGESQ